MVEGGMSCVKYILFVFNFIFVIFGGLLIYLGFMIIQESVDFKEFIETPDTMAIGVIIVGFFIFLIAFLGCCGAILESYCVLLSFGIIVTIILLIEVSLAGLAFAFKDNLRGSAEHSLVNAIESYNATDPGAKYTRLLDELQWNVKCCGANNASDWKDEIPISCCPRQKHDDKTKIVCKVAGEPTSSPFSNSFNSDSNRDRFGNPTANSNSVFGNEFGLGSTTESPTVVNAFDRGCVDAVVEAIEGSLGPVGGACLAVALFQLIGIMFAFCLGRAVKREYQVV